MRQNLLPNWIQPNQKSYIKFATVIEETKNFFADKIKDQNDQSNLTYAEDEDMLDEFSSLELETVENSNFTFWNKPAQTDCEDFEMLSETVHNSGLKRKATMQEEIQDQGEQILPQFKKMKNTSFIEFAKGNFDNLGIA